MVPSWADQLLPQLIMKQFDTLLIQFRHIEHMHEGVWLKKKIWGQNDSYENLDNYSHILLLYMHGYCLLGPISSYTSNLMEQFDTLTIQCRHIEHMREGVWFGKNIFIPPQTLFVVGILFSRCPFVRLSLRACVRL